RVWPAATNSLLYGFCLQAGLGVGLWLLARLGRTLLVAPVLITVGAALWNLGLTIGVAGILVGDSTGFESLELPGYSAVMLFLGYLLVSFWGVITFHQRVERATYASQWFLLAALFWFPWIYSTAELLLVTFPVRGVAQSVIVWWYAANLQTVWLGLVGLATIFYFLPKLTARPLHSHYLALFVFWTLMLFGSWSGIPNSAPVPAWMPVISTVATVLLLLPILAVAVSVRGTLQGKYEPAPAATPGVRGDSSLAPSQGVREPSEKLPCQYRSLLRTHPSLSFLGVSVASFLLAGLMTVLGTWFDTAQELHFTWFAVATTQLHLYGFFAMAIFGAVYYILPQLTRTDWASPKLVRAHFWLSLLGLLLLVVPLAIGGLIETGQLLNPNIAFVQIMKSALTFLRVSTLGLLLILVGQVFFLINLVGLVSRFYRSRAMTVYAAATADLRVAEVKA
ncbi:MAG TPA: cbb3-type cytochrome c oxidase subunit I, partial [Bacillota bacterium]|nr:cbb3-type cytochrome c oxidase subunit I [Bacillota bacterium]